MEDQERTEDRGQKEKTYDDDDDDDDDDTLLREGTTETERVAATDRQKDKRAERDTDTQVRLQQIAPGEIIRIRLKIEDEKKQKKLSIV